MDDDFEIERSLKKFNTCKDILAQNNSMTSGVYSIYINDTSRNVWCDMDTDGGGWTVIQRRQDGKTDFYRSWNEFKDGFGNVSAEYWLGNDALHFITTTWNVTLRVDLEKLSGTKGYGAYSKFVVANEANEYQLSLYGYNGNTGDCLKYADGKNFTTHDRDNDIHKTYNCAVHHHGGWWYDHCTSFKFEWKILHH